MEGAILVCGLGQIGYRVTSLLLDMGERVVAVTDAVRPEWARQLTERGVVIHHGDARDEDLLLQAGLLKAKALIACTSSDLTNIEIALDAKRHVEALPVVVRMFDLSLAAQLERSLGISRAIAMSHVAAPAFAAAAFGDHVVAEFDLDDERYAVFRLDLSEDDFRGCNCIRDFEEEHGLEVLTLTHLGSETLDPAIDGRLEAGDTLHILGTTRTLRQLRPELRPAQSTERPRRRRGLRAFDRLWSQTTLELRVAVAVIAVLTFISVAVFQQGMGLTPIDALYYVVTTVTTTGYGDITPKDSHLWVKLYACFLMILGSATVAVLYSIVTDFIVRKRLEQLVGGNQVPEQDHVVVVGVGDVGFRVANELDRMGAKVVVIDGNAGATNLATLRSRMPIVIGDARDAETLYRAGIDRALAIVATTGDDAVNLSIGLAAEAASPSVRSVLRLFDASFANKVQSLMSIDAALSSSRISAPVFASAALVPGMQAAFVLSNRVFSLAAGEGDWTIWKGDDGRLGMAGTPIGISVRGLLGRSGGPEP